MQLGGETDLGVHDAVLGQVRHALPGDALERLRRLHHGDRVGEALEVADKVQARLLRHERAPELRGVDGREASIAGGGGQFDQRFGPQAAVEVVVEEHLRRSPDLIEAGGGVLHYGFSPPPGGGPAQSPLVHVGPPARSGRKLR